MDIVTLSNEYELRLDLEIQHSVQEYNELIALDVAAEFVSVRNAARVEATELLERTGCLRDLDTESLLSRPEMLLALRMACLPPLTRDRMSGLSGVSVKRICSLEEGTLPSRPSGRAKLRDTEIPAIIRAVRHRIDESLAPWIGEGRTPEEDEREKMIEAVSDRAAVMFDSYNVPKINLAKRLERDVEKWLQANGYGNVGHARQLAESDIPAGTYLECVNMVALNGIEVCADYIVAPRSGSGPVLLEICQSANAVYALRNRMATDEAAHRAASLNGSFALILCGHFDAAYVKYQLENGKSVVWHHDLDSLHDLGL